ncbi:uncharacterized protein TNCV_1368781 [Trichonephila clavipes]|nr:uncharacterized protein TNCV_1368781 [Trichonephila clavipes]
MPTKTSGNCRLGASVAIHSKGSSRGISSIPTTRGLLATDHVILNNGQVTWTTSELAPHLLTTTPHHWEDASALDRFNGHRYPTRRVFSGTCLELVKRQATVRCLYHSATAATCFPAENISRIEIPVLSPTCYSDKCWLALRLLDRIQTDFGSKEDRI